MEDTNKQTKGKDLDLITKDCDGNGSLTSSNAEESQFQAKNSGEEELMDNETIDKNISSNGIDSDVKAMDECKGEVSLNPGIVVSDLELIQSDESQRSPEEVKSDNIGDKLKSENMFIMSKGSDGEPAESANESICFNLKEGKNELNNSAVFDDKKLAERSPIIESEKVLSDEDKQSSNENIDVGAINYEKIDNDDHQHHNEIENMPYQETEACMENSGVEPSPTEVVGNLKEVENKVVFHSDVNIEEPVDVISEKINTSNDNDNNIQQIETPMDVDAEDILETDNPLAEQNQEGDDASECKNTSKYDSGETGTSNQSREQILPVSQLKHDEISNKPECVHECGVLHSDDAFANQSNESTPPKTETLNVQPEKSEILNAELANCNDDSQMELGERITDNEVNNIAIDEIESGNKAFEENKENLANDNSKQDDNLTKDGNKQDDISHALDDYIIEDCEPEKQILPLDENETLIQPGGSEEETITGDTENGGPLNETRGKDAEICIIPDDVSPNLSMPLSSDKGKQQTQTIEKVNKGTDGTKEDGKMVEENSESEKSVEKDEEKIDGESGMKNRPVRVAAKLAGNKIKSLVQSDYSQDAMLPQSNAVGVENAKAEESSNPCAQCKKMKVCKFEVIQGGRPQMLCSDQCYNTYRKAVQQEVVDIVSGMHIRKCSQCHLQVSGDENTLSWETMDFCNDECLGKYQTVLGSNCANCKGNVPSVSLGKYCVRFGYDVKQFCTSSCLEEYKKGLKVCSYCQKDISSGSEGFLAPVGDKGQFKDFCTQSCMEKYEQMSNNAPLPNVVAECAVCSNSKPVKVEVELENKTQKLCSEPCFAAFKFVNNITEGQCDMCKKYFDKLKTGSFSIYYEDSPHSFCCKTCMNVYILANRKIVPCNWCKVKKYNFDMIKKVNVNGQVLMMCSLNCLTLYQVSVNAVSSRRIMCDFCLSFAQATYHLTMSDTSVRNFCSYSCVISFQNQFPKQTLSLPSAERLASPIPTGGPKKILPRRSQASTAGVPVISSVQSLASPNGPVNAGRVSIPAGEVGLVPQVASVSQPIAIQPTAPAMSAAPPAPQVYQQIITKPPPVKQQKNKSILCKPYSHTKGVSCRPHPCMKETQTDESLNRKFLIPIPVPIYVPAPMHMFASPFPVAVPFPLPVPVPIFIPTTRNSAKGILKEIKKIQEKIPTDPFEAELLMMAEMVAGDKKQDPTDSESDDGNDGDDGGDGTFSPENVDTSNTFGEDMLQMALKMATELEEPAVDMESVLTSNTITPSSQPTVDPNKGLYDDPDQVQVLSMGRGRKRSMRGSRNSSGGNQSKRGRRISGSNVDVPMLPPPEPVPPPRIEVEKPDANMCLKYTFGVNAWRHWVMQKNAELEKVAMTNRKIKLFKPELLQLTADELNFSLCLFVKEVRKPNGTEYAPDTIYYLCLGIQQYLFENGRIDNIFTDSYYEKFTDCLDEVAKKFAALYNDSQYIVTRVEEEHLWESKQLGAHSPHVLLSTLMFFNTKHFNLVTVEEHMQLSFSHIMKHWKRNPNAPGVAKVPGSRNVLLRFYPPQSALEANSRKKKVYEQQENEENPLRCPVKLYEFYLSKCPESVKTRNDVFYLLPERSCVPDSPVWYSTMALGKEPLTKMLHRVKMVKEINIALLTC